MAEPEQYFKVIALVDAATGLEVEIWHCCQCASLVAGDARPAHTTHHNEEIRRYRELKSLLGGIGHDQ